MLATPSAGLGSSAEVDERYVPKEHGHASAEMCGTTASASASPRRQDCKKAPSPAYPQCGSFLGQQRHRPSKNARSADWMSDTLSAVHRVQERDGPGLSFRTSARSRSRSGASPATLPPRGIFRLNSFPRVPDVGTYNLFWLTIAVPV